MTNLDFQTFKNYTQKLYQIDSEFDATQTDRLAMAKHHLEQLGLDEVVKLEQADGKDYLAQSKTPFDMIFLDAERKFYMDYIKDLKRLMIFQSVLVVDNVVSHASEVTDFLAEFESDDSFLCTTLPIGAGLFVAVKQGI